MTKIDETYLSKYSPNSYALNVIENPLGPRDDGDEVEFQVRTPKSGDNLTIDATDAVDLAVRLLERFAPQRLVPPKFSDTPVGTFLRRKLDGLIVRVAPAPESQQKNVTENDTVWVVKADGLGFPAYQDAEDPAWVELEPDQVKVQTTWALNI